MERSGTPLQDGHGRILNYMRVSLTDACNFHCGFCMPPGARPAAERGPALTREETLRLCGVFAGLGVDSFKVTGGEPFLSPDALPILAGLKRTPCVRSVTVTTNGSTLDRYARKLAAMEIDGVNVSVNAMTQERFRAVTGVDFELRRVLDNVVLAKSLGLTVKLNMVPLRGVNTDDMIPLLEFALERDMTVRFIELMPIGQGRRCQGLPFAEVRRIVEGRFGPAEVAAGRFGNGPATYLSLKGYGAKVGYIAAVSERFCAACNRLRLSGTGFLRTCLHHSHGVDLARALRAGETDAELARRIRAVVADKPGSHRFGNAENAADFADEQMYRIGG